MNPETGDRFRFCFPERQKETDSITVRAAIVFTVSFVSVVGLFVPQTVKRGLPESEPAVHRLLMKWS